MNDNTTVTSKKQELTWKEIIIGLIDLPTLASKVNELTKECEQLIK